jgi:hypothetical protein
LARRRPSVKYSELSSADAALLRKWLASKRMQAAAELAEMAEAVLVRAHRRRGRCGGARQDYVIASSARATNVVVAPVGRRSVAQ